MDIVRESSCVRDLLWRCDLPAAVDIESFLGEMRSAGYLVDSLSPDLRYLKDPTGNVVVVLPRTGRVQIRVCYAVPREQRPATAREVAASVQGALDAAGAGGRP